MDLYQQPTIFVVEDNLIYQQLIRKELESLSTDIHFFTTGENCLQHLFRNPSIIILDYNLAGEINGLDTLQEIRKYDATIYVILFSNQKDLNSEENFVQYGSFNFLEKREQSFRVLRKMINSTCLTFSR